MQEKGIEMIKDNRKKRKEKVHQIVAGSEIIIGESARKCRDCTGRESESAETRFGLGSECDGECNRS